MPSFALDLPTSGDGSIALVLCWGGRPPYGIAVPE
jgi:hypothetical protein